MSAVPRSCLSTLYKSTGVTHDTPEVSPMTPQARAKRLAGCQDVEGLFGRAPLIALVDHRLQSKDVHILNLLSFATRNKGNAAIAFNELAWAVGSSRSTVIRSILRLESCGYIEAARSHNKRNAYRVNGLVRTGTVSTLAAANPAAVPTARRGKPTVLCPTCRQMRYGLLRVGYCRSCNWKRNVRAVFHEEMAKTA